ncbi:MAG TPA: hypothetical protein VG125_22795 [Pirellulales bacterium]|jgi:hypothetical protein|nr:hypothetical protein [Pirellulales bacterium]
MDRIISSLASFTVLLMLIAVGVGLALHSADVRDTTSETALSWYRTHFMLGVGTGIAVVLVNSLAITYFIGTSRWCKEVAQAYSLDRGIIQSSNQAKRRAFPYALANMLLIVGVSALGGAADPAGNLKSAPPGGLSWAQWHLVGAVTAIFAIAAGYMALWRAIGENQRIVDRVMAEVGRIRRERGLE